MYFLVHQMLIEEETFDIGTLQNNIKMYVIIRKVEAETKEEAIGKFIVNTASLKFTKRIDPINCIEFDTLITI